MALLINAVHTMDWSKYTKCGKYCPVSKYYLQYCPHDSGNVVHGKTMDQDWTMQNYQLEEHIVDRENLTSLEVVTTYHKLKKIYILSRCFACATTGGVNKQS